MRGNVIVTRNSKRSIALVAADENTLEEFILARHPALVREVAKARQEYRVKVGVSLRQMQGRVRHRRIDA